MGRSALILVVLAQVVAACSTAGSASPSATISRSPTPAPTATATVASASQSTPTSTSAPTASATTSNACSHPQRAYTVSYPSDWYTNAGTETDIGCTRFGPDPLGDDPATDTGAVIVLLAEPDLGWNNPLAPLTGEFEGYRILVDEATTIGGRSAWVREYELTLAEPGTSVGDLRISYSVLLENDWFLTSTATARPDGYDAARAILEEMLEGLEVPTP
jgi:hypothetical protein